MPLLQGYLVMGTIDVPSVADNVAAGVVRNASLIKRQQRKLLRIYLLGRAGWLCSSASPRQAQLRRLKCNPKPTFPLPESLEDLRNLWCCLLGLKSLLSFLSKMRKIAFLFGNSFSVSLLCEECLLRRPSYTNWNTLEAHMVMMRTKSIPIGSMRHAWNRWSFPW